MLFTRARFVTLALVCALPATAQGQAADDTLRVPAGILKLLEVPVETDRPFALLRAIRVLYSAPRQDPTPQAIADFERLLAALERLERELARSGARGLSLGMAAKADDRDAFRDTLDALGLRARDERRTYSVEPQTGNTAARLRELLLVVGVDAADVQKRLNAGETVQITRATIGLPLPLPFERWATDVFDNRVTRDALFNAIIRSREASLLYYGLQSMTADTRAYLARTPGLVQSLHGRAPIVAAFGAAFRVGADGRVNVPGGAEAEELWEALAGEEVTQPARFARELFGRDAGRLAYFADTLWTLDEAHARFALGLGISEPRLRQRRFLALYDVFAQTDPTWSFAETPFKRPSYDAALLLSNLRLNESGSVAPAHRRLWERGVNGIDIPDATDRQMREPAEDGVADAAFLAGLLPAKLPRERQMILERVDFAQRNFAGSVDAEMQDVLVALRAYGRFPTAMLALERIGIRTPAQFALAARRAAALEAADPSNAVPLLAQFQGSLALLERLARTGAVAPPLLQQLVGSLIAIEFDEGHYRGRIAQWLRTQLIPALPPAPEPQTAEARLLDALVDRMAAGTAPFSWEGEDFVVDTERPRRELRALRERQKGNTLDVLFAVYEHAADLADSALRLEGVKSSAAALKASEASLSAARPWPDAADVPVIAKVVERVVKDLNGIRRESDVRRAESIARPLVDALDYLLGETLVALAYAASIGDTGRGPAAAIDISHRHVFGNTTTLGDDRRLVPWRRPTRGSAAGAGDAVSGSVMGLDLALSRSRLRRLASDRLPETPKLNANDHATITDTVALLNPRGLDDARGAEIAAAIARGRMRVEQAAGDSAALDVLAVEARIAASRRGLLEWTVRHSPRDLLALFSLAELFRLGGGQRAVIDGWGTSHEALTGCFCLRFPDDTGWEFSIGRADTGQAGARAAELNLRVAVLLADLRIPATLFPFVMALATQDYIDSVPLVHPDDWAAFVGRAAAISRERVEDYVSAVVASGPVRAVEAAGAR